MADAIGPIAVCAAAGVGAACIDAVAQSMGINAASFGLTLPALFWAGVGCYAGDILARRQEAMPRHKLTFLVWLVSMLIGALFGNWVAGVMFGGERIAVAGASAFLGATWQALFPVLQDVGKTLLARIGSKQ